MRSFTEDMGYAANPFPWDEENRAAIRAELDALFFQLYLPGNLDVTWKKSEKEADMEYESLVTAFPASTGHGGMHYGKLSDNKEK